MSLGCDVGGTPPVDCGDVVEADRIMTLNVLGKARRVVGEEICDPWALLGRVHVEMEAGGAVERGAMIAGGYRFANALAGHIALRDSIVDLLLLDSGEGGGGLGSADVGRDVLLRARGRSWRGSQNRLLVFRDSVPASQLSDGVPMSCELEVRAWYGQDARHFVKRSDIG